MTHPFLTHKRLAQIAVIMAIVFGVIVMAYPRLFSPQSSMPIEAQPAAPPPVAP